MSVDWTKPIKLVGTEKLWNYVGELKGSPDSVVVESPSGYVYKAIKHSGYVGSAINNYLENVKESWEEAWEQNHKTIYDRSPQNIFKVAFNLGREWTSKKEQ